MIEDFISHVIELLEYLCVFILIMAAIEEVFDWIREHPHEKRIEPGTWVRLPYND